MTVGPLKLIVLRYGNDSRAGLSTRVTQGRFSIGRGKTNDWVLDDPEKHLSNRHCIIEKTGDDSYTITDVSTNGVYINGADQPLGNGNAAPLHDGDRITIGDYQIRAEIEGAARDSGEIPPFDDSRDYAFDSILKGEGSSGPYGGLGAERRDPLAGPERFGAAPSRDPFAGSGAGGELGFSQDSGLDLASDPMASRPGQIPDMFGPLGGRGAAHATSDHVPGINSAFTPPQVRGPVIPLDWNPLEGDPLAAPAAAPAVSPFEASPIARQAQPHPSAPGWAAPAAPAPGSPGPIIPPDAALISLDEGFSQEPARIPQPLPLDAVGPGAVGPGAAGPGAAGPGAAGPGVVGPGAIGVGVMGAGALALDAAPPAGIMGEEIPPWPGPAQAIPAAIAPIPDLPRAPMQAGRPAISAAPVPIGGPAPPANAGASPRAIDGGADLLRAFLEGAGLPADTPGLPNPEARMRAYGELFRELVSGMRELLAARAVLKSEFRMVQTVIRGADNNPLKFSVDVEQAMRALLAPSSPGYSGPLPAVRQAVDDLKAHEMGLIAGLQSAVAELMNALSPDEIMRHAHATGLLGHVYPGARRAEYWNTYEKVHRRLKEQIGEDAESIFRKSFAQAYTDQVKKH